MPKRKRPATCHPNRFNLANGLCKQCYDKSPERLDARRKYRKAHAIELAERHLKHRHKLSIEEYNNKLYEQNGQCAICGSETSGHKNQPRLLVDHCHRTGKIRGLLCDKCNRGMGQFDDNPELLILAIEYLRHYQE